MRSTLTIDPDVARQLQELMARSKLPFKTVVNDALRRGLSAPVSEVRTPFSVRPLELGWNATLDPIGFNRLLDEMAADEFVEIDRQPSSRP